MLELRRSGNHKPHDVKSTGRITATATIVQNNFHAGDFKVAVILRDYMLKIVHNPDTCSAVRVWV